MAGTSRVQRAAGTASELMEQLGKIRDRGGALELVRRLLVEVEDRERLLRREVAQEEKNRETRLKIAAGAAALRVLVHGTEEEREWMRVRLERLLEGRDREEVFGATGWLEALWARREAAGTSRGKAEEAGRRKAARVDGNGLPRDAGDGGASCHPDPGPLAVTSVQFRDKPGEGVLAVVRGAGLAWSKEHQCWRPKNGAAVINQAQASAIRAAGGEIAEA